MGQGKASGGLRVRALGNRYLGAGIKNPAHTLQLCNREVWVLAGELEEQSHPYAIGPTRR
jgi:hypothetical protein